MPVSRRAFLAAAVGSGLGAMIPRAMAKEICLPLDEYKGITINALGSAVSHSEDNIGTLAIAVFREPMCMTPLVN